MRTISSITTLALAISGSALAQDSARIEGSAASRSQTSINAAPGAAEVSHQQSTSAAVASERASGALHGGGELNATLDATVDVRDVQPGDEVTATITDDVMTDGGVLIHGGARLVGRVTAAQPRQRGSRRTEEERRSHLGLIFDRAILADGREVPLNATVQALAAAQAAASAGARDVHGWGSAPGAAGATGAARGGARGGGSIAGGVAGTAGAAGTAGGIGSAASGGTGRAASGTIGGMAGTAGTAGRAAGGAGTITGTAGAAGAATRAGGSGLADVSATSAGAQGGVDAAGRLMAGSRGAFGLSELDIASAAAGSAHAAGMTGAAGAPVSDIGSTTTSMARTTAAADAQATVITSATRHVRLESGTRMLLVTSATAGPGH